MNQNRDPKGVPSGGQFAASQHAEVDISLTGAAADPDASWIPTDGLGERSLFGRSYILAGCRIDWDELGEGFNGEYDPADPDDVELLRFTIYRNTYEHPRDATWVECEGGSWCTEIPVSTDLASRQRMLESMMTDVGRRVRESDEDPQIGGLVENWSRLDVTDIPEGPKAHCFSDAREAYDQSQCDDSISDGDLLIIPESKTVGILYEAWPVEVSGDTDEVFHLPADNDWEMFLLKNPRYQDAYNAALKVAESF